MIMVDIDLPADCMSCPMAVCIYEGQWRGHAFCSAMESRADKDWIGPAEEKTQDNIIKHCLIDLKQCTRPSDCPIVAEVYDV